MKNYGLNELRKMYLNFFETKAHLKVNSYPLVPKNDKSLLLINSGMAPLKPYFTGQEVPPRKRMTTCQKCIRTGDIENVGKTARHGTFFEMLGNFSFGDYFKEEAIKWAWEFVTATLEIPENRLYVSVYEEDIEAENMWIDLIGLPKERIVRLGKKDNFWEHGVGPCGPCSEIYYDRGEKYGCDSPTCAVGCDCDRYMEFWNLVFTQFEKDDEGKYTLLKNPNIDTGMGLERLATMMQDVDSIFDVDTIRAVRDEVCRVANITYKSDPTKDISIRLITDHVRSVSFMTADGILPSNEGRGYVLRRLLRRAARHGRLLNISGKFLADLSKVVIATSCDAYPELKEKEDYIYKLITVEEDRFNETIDQGLDILTSYLDEIKSDSEKVLVGEKVFKLYDTYGFPVDLTKEICEEKGVSVDEEAFKVEMQKQKERARNAREESTYMGASETVYHKLSPTLVSHFVGYNNLAYQGKVTALANLSDIVNTLEAGQEGTIFVDETPFYAESGGQAADTGEIHGTMGKFIVKDVKKVLGGKFAHIGYVEEGHMTMNDRVKLIVNADRRHDTMKNHSATHLLQKALKEVLGSHIEQAGSLVDNAKFRFDFTHFAPMTEEEIRRVESIVNKAITKSIEVNITEMNIDEAKKMGAMALFGEKYSSNVRVVNMGGYSIELCGGTHVTNTKDIGLFKITSENGVAAGVRRIEGLTSESAFNYYFEAEKALIDIANYLKVEPQNIIKKLQNLTLDMKKLNQENEKLQGLVAKASANQILDQVIEIDGIKVLVADVKNQDMNSLRNLGDSLKDKLGDAAVLLGSVSDGKVSLVAMMTDSSVKKGLSAGDLIKNVAPIVGGGGGGKPQMAQAGGKEPNKLDEALTAGLNLIKSKLN